MSSPFTVLSDVAATRRDHSTAELLANFNSFSGHEWFTDNIRSWPKNCYLAGDALFTCMDTSRKHADISLSAELITVWVTVDGADRSSWRTIIDDAVEFFTDSGSNIYVNGAAATTQFLALSRKISSTL